MGQARCHSINAEPGPTSVSIVLNVFFFSHSGAVAGFSSEVPPYSHPTSKLFVTGTLRAGFRSNSFCTHRQDRGLPLLPVPISLCRDYSPGAAAKEQGILGHSDRNADATRPSTTYTEALPPSYDILVLRDSRPRLGGRRTENFRHLIHLVSLETRAALILIRCHCHFFSLENGP